MPSTETTLISAQPVGMRIGALVGLAALADITLVWAYSMQGISIVAVMALHLGIVGLFPVLYRVLVSRTGPLTWVMTAILALFGPFGGPALMLIAPWEAKSLSASDQKVQTDAALRRADSAEGLADSIVQRRRHPLPTTGMPGFVQVFRTGTLRQQQGAIAAISRQYHPAMRPALATALASPVPALRVQAAAVHAKLRGKFEAQAKAILADPASVDAATIQAVANSGFVDAQTCEQLAALDGGKVPPKPVASRSALEPGPILKRYSCGGLA